MSTSVGSRRGRRHESVAAGPVFDLSVGFTGSTVSMGVADYQCVAGPVPEPASWLLLLVGAGALSGRRRANRRA